MTRINFKSNITKWLVAVFLLLAATFLLIWRLMPVSHHDMLNSVVAIEHRYYYTLCDADSALLYFDGIDGDSAFVNAQPDKNEVITYSSGCWTNRYPIVPSCNGTIAAAVDLCDSISSDTSLIKTLINNELHMQYVRLSSIRHAQNEVRYYIDTHSTKDDGYADVAEYRSRLKTEKEQVRRFIEILKKSADGRNLSVVTNETLCAFYKDTAGVRKMARCSVADADKSSGIVILQTSDSITPSSVHPADMWHPLPFSLKNVKDTVLVTGCTYTDNKDIKDRYAELIPEYISGDTLKMYPQLRITDGSPVFTRNGIFLGITRKDRIIYRNTLRKHL